MKAIILAAGVGNRLKPITDRIPKCMVSFNGKSIIRKYIEILHKFNIKDIVIVVGHLKEKIFEHLKDYPDIKYIYNPDYKKGNILTMWYARKEFDDDIIFMDADVVFHEKLFEKLINSPHKNCYLMDVDYVAETGEECIVAALNGRVVANNRKITKKYDTAGEGLGLLKMSMETAKKFGEILEKMVSEGKVLNEYEDALEILLEQDVFGYEKTEGLPWREIDFVEDIRPIEEEILPKINF